jgi:hypothetical protein
MLPNIARDASRPGRMTHQKLARPAMTAAIKSNAAGAVGRREHHLIIPDVGIERPVVTKNDRPPLTPLLAVNFGAVFRRNVAPPSSTRTWPAGRPGRDVRVGCNRGFGNGTKVEAARRPMNKTFGRPAALSLRPRWSGIRNLQLKSAPRAAAAAYFETIERSRNWRIIGAITSSLSSRAKCPVSSRCSSALGRSRR